MNNAINWVTLPYWHLNGLVGLSKARGLVRVRLNGETVFLGCAPKGNLGARLGAYRRGKGTGQNHQADRLIYEHRAKVEMQIAILEKPAHEIEQLLEAELRKGLPTWNVPGGHRFTRKKQS